MSNNLLPVFVYGTLRHDQGNYSRILRGATIHEEPAILPQARMYDGGGCPFVVRDETGHVVGEIMYLDPDTAEDTMRDLDRLEGFHGFDSTRNLYDRTQVEVVRPDGSSVTVWTYLTARGTMGWLNDMPQVRTGDWLNRDTDAAFAVTA